MESSVRDKLPDHIAVIMDGNGRWAERKKLNRILGHQRGIKRARECVDTCKELGIKYLTLYTFSRENWNRPPFEVNKLMGFLAKHLRGELKGMNEDKIRFRAVGNLWELPSHLQEIIQEAEYKTMNNDGLCLTLALSYSGRAEIVEASKRLAKDVRDGKVNENDVDEFLFTKYLYTRDIPDPDLLVRTGGDFRISNFLLWQLAYTEIYVTNCLWPDFTKDELIRALRDFQSRERRFGMTGEQLKKKAW
jgi:undecaprenyl diphosphate synthase